MTSSFVNNLRLEEMQTGDQSGTWGTTTNNNLERIADAFGFGNENVFDADENKTATVADGSADNARAMYIKVTGSATLSATRTLTIAPNDIKRLHFIENATTGSQTITIKQGSGATVDIANGQVKAVYLDGGGSAAAVVEAFAHLSVTDLTADDDITLKSDSAVLGFGADTDTTLTHTDGTGLTLNGTNKLTFGDAASFVHQSSDGVLTIDGEATIDLNASTAVLVSNDLKLDSDAAVLGFGVNNDVTLTHVHDSALLLNDAIKMTFRDSALAINSSTDGQLDIDADTEVEITAPTIDLTASTAVTVSNDITVTGRASGTVTTNTNGQMDLAVSNHFNYTPSGDDEIELDNFVAGQSGTIFLDNSGGHQISVDSTILINADQLSAVATAGKYMLSYFCTVDQPNATLSNSANDNKIIMSVSGALT